MKRFAFIVLSIFILFGTVHSLIHADSFSDYEYQYSQYRAKYTEFTQLKRDYLANPTLDNQQKSIITAKQALLARDLSKAAYAGYLTDIITAQKTNYSAFDPILIKLNQAANFYNAQSQLSQKITNPKELQEYSSNYEEEAIVPDRSFFYGQVAAKLAQLVRFQLDAKKTLDSIYPKFPNPLPLPLKSRLDEIPLQANLINTKISTVAAMIIPEQEENPLSVDQYFVKPTESLIEIRNLQSSLVDQLIDIDLNYAQ